MIKTGSLRTVACICAVVGFLSSAAQAETRGFVIGYFHTATYQHKDNCPHGGNGGYGHIRESAYRSFGYDEARTQELINGATNTADFTAVARRGKKDGKPVSVYLYPASHPDPNHELVSGPYAWGFNLDGKEGDAATAFEDPETGEQGVDNQLFRAVGCYDVYNISLPVRPLLEETVWSTQLFGSRHAGAWLFAITGENLSADGPATVSFYRAIRRLRRDAFGKALPDATYVVEPDSFTVGTLRGAIRNGVFITEPGNETVILEGEPPTFTKMELAKARLRLNLHEDRSATGYMAGYQPWADFWFMNASGGEQFSAVDVVALYYNLKKLADAKPDPRTGENTSISATYRVDAAPAFLVRPDGTLVASAR